MFIFTQTSRRMQDKYQSCTLTVKDSKVVKEPHLALGRREDQLRTHPLYNQNLLRLAPCQSNGLILKSLDNESSPFESFIQGFCTPFLTLSCSCCVTQSESIPPVTTNCTLTLASCIRTFQSSVLTKLLEWGAAALEKSLNQPSLPHAIVLLNDTEPGIDEKEWETDYATKSLLSSVNGALDYVEGVPRFRELAQHWRNLGKQISTVEDLILRYYSSFKVVRMPRKPRYMFIDRQVARLHDEIRASCSASFRAKRKARMVTNSEELNIYLQSAFEHFTRTLTTPFNFVAVSLLNNPISYDFGGHMLQLANTIAAQEPFESADSSRSSWIFESMCAMIASCIMLDCARYRKGRVEDLFDSYKKFFDWTLREYCDMWLSCGFSNGQGRKCMLVKARHNTKGHQDEDGIIAHGEYQSSFSVEIYGPVWQRHLKSAISVVQRAFCCEQDQSTNGDHVVSDDKIARRLHRQYAAEFFTVVGTADRIFSHASCFCCLMEVPEHPLPCGHVLCAACVHTYGKSSYKCVVEMSYCPLHMEETRWTKPHIIKFKHKGAGTRVLCLDGGGIRGIVELEVLRAIEQALGGEIPVQDFFDLIVGTSTGGIIALALGVQHYPVDQCIEMFTSLCDHAYTPRLKGMPLFDLAASISHGSRYKTKQFHEALKEAFGDKEYLFGGRNQSDIRGQNKVAVTSTSSTGGRAIVIANYRRKEDGQADYDFERPHEPELEMRVWEAAAATSAAPTYFKPFVNSMTRRTYLDGALQNNNPARLANRERRLIWPENADADPDILLSLGTGQNRISILPKLSVKTADWRTLQSSLQTAPVETPKGVTRLLRSWSVLYNRVDDILNAEVAWAAFRNDVVTADRSQRNSRRYIRFNPDLDKRAPSVDAKNELKSLQWTVKKRLGLPHCVTAVQHVAFRLVASSFFLDVSKQAAHGDGSHLFECSIFCKFDNGTRNVRSLGRFLKKMASNDFHPHLVIKGDASDTDGNLQELSSSLIDRMINEATFSPTKVMVVTEDDNRPSNVSLVLGPHDGLETAGFPLSGMPKILANECGGKSAQGRLSKRGSPSSPTPVRNKMSSGNGSRPCSISLQPRPNRKLLWAPSAGPLAGLRQLERADMAPEVHIKPFNTEPSISYRAVKGPNRFWTYIAPAHMAKHRHLYSHELLEKFVPSIAPEPIELDAGDDSEIKRMTYAELENDYNQFKRASIHHEVHAESSATVPQRTDSAKDLHELMSVTETVVADYASGTLPPPVIPPPFPLRTRGFDPGELEAAIEAAFG